ncbi:hypothetical protein [Paenibacillus chitinolyticus]
MGFLEDYLSFLLVIGCVVFKRFAIFFVVHRVGTSFRESILTY